MNEETERLIWELNGLVSELSFVPPYRLAGHEHELSKIYASLGSLIFSINNTNTKP